MPASSSADELADLLGQPGRVHPRHLADIGSLGEFELVVNATSAARGDGLPALPRSLLGRRMAAVDLNYGEAAVPFLAWGRASGAYAVVDGLGMLVEQAALAFARWQGVRPETDGIYGELRAEHAHLVTAD